MEEYQLWIAFGMMLITLIASIASYIKSNNANRIANESLIIAKESKANTLREKIHSEQIKVAKKIWECIAEYEDLLYEINKIDKKENLYKKIQKDMDEVFDDLLDDVSDSQLFFDNETNLEISKSIKSISLIDLGIRQGKGFIKSGDSFINIQDQLRSILGIVPLSSENREIFNSIKKKNPKHS